jgi:hypothetical protein
MDGVKMLLVCIFFGAWRIASGFCHIKHISLSRDTNLFSISSCIIASSPNLNWEASFEMVNNPGPKYLEHPESASKSPRQSTHQSNRQLNVASDASFMGHILHVPKCKQHERNKGKRF